MMISVLISILLQLGFISNASDFDISKSEQYIQEVNRSNIIIDDEVLCYEL